MRRVITALLTLPFAMTMQSQHTTTTLASLRDRARPLLIFAGPNDVRAGQQYAELATHANEVKDRDMRIVLLTTGNTELHDKPGLPEAHFSQEEAMHLRQRFHIGQGEFTVLLIGKDGGEKLRSNQFIPWSKLADTIDGMPMRQQEMRNR